MVERVGQGNLGVEPLEAVVGEGEGVEEGGGDAHGEGGGAEIVVEAGEGDLGGGAGSADLGIALVDGDADASAGEGDGGSETVGAGADDVCGVDVRGSSCWVWCVSSVRGEGVWRVKIGSAGCGGLGVGDGGLGG